MKKATAEDMRRIEALAVERGDSFLSLMERAGQAVAEWILREWLDNRTAEGLDTRVVIVCGKGNNGGDGFVIARRLAAFADVTVVLAAGKPKTDIALDNFSRLPSNALTVLDYAEEPYLCSAAVRQADMLVDCVYGIGFHGELSAGLLPLFRQMNAATGYKVAVDMPSGVNADNGDACDGAFAADVTLTFTALKEGLNSNYSGSVQLLDIGISPEVVRQVLGQKTITEEMVRACFAPRPLDSHKGTFGRVLLVAGSYGMAGAAILAAKAALRSGAGQVTVATPRSIYPIVAAVVPEAIFLPLDEDEDGCVSSDAVELIVRRAQNADAVVLGCGLGCSVAVTQLFLQLRRRVTCPLILDADGINAVKPHMLVEETAFAPLILTPHPGEMARLLDSTIDEVQCHREEIARRFADDYGVVLALKGYHTLVAAPARPLMQNDTGNPGMATGGSGDVLAGLIGGLTAQGMDPYFAAMCGVYIHGAAGDRAAQRLSQHAMLPSDILEELGSLFLNLEK